MEIFIWQEPHSYIMKPVSIENTTVSRNEKTVFGIGRFPINVVAVFVLSISRMKKWELG